MRAAPLALLAALAIGGLGLSVQAQTSPPAPQPTAGKPMDGEKASHNPKETGTNHVDALSRDETRRLERLRAKAAGGSKGHEAATPAKPGEVVKRDERPSSPAATNEPATERRARSARHAPRRTREASEAPRSRGRASARSGAREVADRAPRLGDVVPSNIPLYPLGSSGDRAYPPFPRVNGYAPRRVFEEPDD